MYILDSNSKTPLHKQLYEQLKDDITNNLKIGDKLPSIRKIATTYNISKTTVQNAYSQLYAEGYIDSKDRSGYYVCEVLFDATVKSSVNKGVEDTKLLYKYDFFPAQLHSSDFPIKIWKRLFNKVVNADINFGAYPDAKGELALREQIALYLQSSRGVNADANSIIITHGFADSMELIAKLLKQKYNSFAIESPGYHLAKRVFVNYDYKVDDIDVKQDGLQVDNLVKSGSKIVYITPSHQYPTGVVMPVYKRVKLLEYISKIDGVIIEDDYDSELAYYNRPIPSLQGLDSNNRVIYLGTFAKALSPAIRVGYMVVPNWFLKEFAKSYDAHFARVSVTVQLTLAKFIKDGHFDRHIRKIRTINKNKHNQMLNAIKKYLNSYKIVAQGAGLAILISPTKPFDFEKLQKLAVANSLKIYLTQSVTNSDFKAVRLGFGGFSLEEIDNAILEFSKIWEESFVYWNKESIAIDVLLFFSRTNMFI